MIEMGSTCVEREISGDYNIPHKERQRNPAIVTVSKLKGFFSLKKK